MTPGLAVQGTKEAREVLAVCGWRHNAAIAAHKAMRAMKRLGIFIRFSWIAIRGLHGSGGCHLSGFKYSCVNSVVNIESVENAMQGACGGKEGPFGPAV